MRSSVFSSDKRGAGLGGLPGPPARTAPGSVARVGFSLDKVRPLPRLP